MPFLIGREDLSTAAQYETNPEALLYDCPGPSGIAIKVENLRGSKRCGQQSSD